MHKSCNKLFEKGLQQERLQMMMISLGKNEEQVIVENSSLTRKKEKKLVLLLKFRSEVLSGGL